MKKIITFLLLPAGCLLLLLFIFLILVSPEKKEFERLCLKEYTLDQTEFRVDKRLRKIFFKRGKDEIWLKELPTINGYPFYIKGKKAVKIVPGISGEAGFYSYLFFDNLKNKTKIQFSLEINREGKTIGIDQVTAAHSSNRYVRNLKLKKKDILVFKFMGQGIGFLSNPIIYKKTPVKKRKYVFLIGLDTLRWDQVGAKTGNLSLTPHIDRFKKDCLCFENAYAQCSWTLPSFMSLFTGLYEFNHGVDIATPLDPAIPTLTEKASETFITFGFHSGMGMRKRWGYSRGFDYYKKVPYTGPLYPRAGQSLFRAAQKLLEETEFPNLFFFLHTYQVHDPYTPPLDFLLKLNKHPSYKRLDVVNQNAPWKTFLPVEERLEKSLKELYQAEIHAFDSYFGEFVKKLKEMGIYDNAMIVFLSDHGEEFFEHKGWAHSHSLYNELIKVPVLIKFPGSEFKGKRVNDTVGLIDMMPTLLSYYNVESCESGIDGIDLMPKIRGKKETHHRECLVSSISESRYIREIPPKFALICGDIKIIYNETFGKKDLDYFRPYALPPQTPRIEVYDLLKDPLEKHNIADEKTGLVKKLLPLIKKIKDTIKKNMVEKKKRGTPLDEEAKKQLESLGYI